jgi:hypothetical protein
VLVLGVDAPDATNAGHHDMQVTASYLASLPARVRDHLTCRVVPDLNRGAASRHRRPARRRCLTARLARGRARRLPGPANPLYGRRR